MKRVIRPNCLSVLLVCVAGVVVLGCRREPESGGETKAVTQLTYHRDVAPLVQESCSPCHRPGQSAPFPLLKYEDFKERARQVAEVVESRYMPPWLPAPGYNHFKGDRSLDDSEIATILRWVDQGAPEGNPADAPPPPSFDDAWMLGTPDLVVTLETPYELEAEGPDIYRNFVVPIPLETSQAILAMEFRPGTGSAVHHAFFAFDETVESRKLDERDPQPGFDGVHLPSSSGVPDGHFFSWQPGKQPMGGEPSRAWRLKPGTDLIIQMHLQPQGKPEKVQPSVAFYFADTPGDAIAYKVGLSNYHIDIPAGATNYVAEDAFTLPCEVELLGILPHAHYLATEMQGIATLPDGTSRWLLKINQWDFNWQGEYMYEEPLHLPAGTRIGMRFFYDNSAGNPGNPSVPPKQVRFGLQSTDEMAELWLLFRLKSEQDRRALNDTWLPLLAEDVITYNQMLLMQDPANPVSWVKLGKAKMALRKNEEAQRDLQRAVQLDSEMDEAYYYLGLIAFDQDKMDRAKEMFDQAVRANPDHYKAYGYLGLVYMRQGDLTSAEASLQRSLEIKPGDEVAASNLELVKAKQKLLMESGTPLQ